MTPTQAATLEAIKTYCLKHYNDDFYYSTIIECYEDDELLAELKSLNVRSLNGFIEATRPVREIYADRIADAKNSAF